jgi:GNAT superfamily N-acetyltransferase
VKRDLGDGFELDDDPARVDLAAVHAFLTTSYWAKGRTLEVEEQLLRDASRVVGLYHGTDQIGCCRAVAVSPSLAYLADVYVLPEFRGRGLGTELVREMTERGPYRGHKWFLHTSDAHELYRKLGFDVPSAKVMERRGAAGA